MCVQDKLFNLPSYFFFFRYITQQGHKLEVGAPRPPATVTNAVSWRSEGIKYRKNEVFMDVIESVNLLVRTFHPCSYHCFPIKRWCGKKFRHL